MSTHASKLERWLGAEYCELLSANMQGWYGAPIAIGSVPGAVYAAPGGDFVGPLRGGGFASLRDYLWDKAKAAQRRAALKQRSQMNTGFSSLSDLISELTTGGKRQDWWFSKAGPVSSSGQFESLWGVGNMPSIGAAPSAIPGGSVPTRATAGTFPITNPGGADTAHLLTSNISGSTAPNFVLLYDRTFHAATVLHNTTSGQTVSGTPNRYTTTESPGVFMNLEVTTVLGATAQNVTVTYTDDAGNSGAGPATAITTSAIAGRICHSPWFIPLNSGDVGVRAVTSIAMSAANTGGVSNLVMGKPLAWLPCNNAGALEFIDGINSAVNFVPIKTDACLAMLAIKGVSSLTTYTGSFIIGQG